GLLNTKMTVYSWVGNDMMVLTFPEQAVCQFPFIYKDKPHYECVNDDKYPWCGLTENVDDDWKRGWCPDKVEAGTNGGNSNGAPCVFPFVAYGKDFNRCTSEKRRDGRLWCATTKSYDKDAKYVVLTFPEQAVCQFPFIYKDKPHYECVNDDKYPWCGLTENVDDDWKRGWCPDKGMSIGNRVELPLFPENGENYTFCISNGRLLR
uniref:Fibronectin type-II domain-containing protein n=1 Tax=Eptatretus burgeri TaxID=7764 RepID=A0A8C4R6E0_EPTBU